MKLSKYFTTVGALFGLTGVALGAFGAHVLEARLAEYGSAAVWGTAVDYQMWHALAILILIALRLEGCLTNIAVGCFCAGIPLFSGSLYWLALDGPRWLGPITPLGGLLFIMGWMLFTISLIRQSKATPNHRS